MPPTQSRFKGLNARNKHSYTFLFQLIIFLRSTNARHLSFCSKDIIENTRDLQKEQSKITDHRTLGTVERQVLPAATLENQSFMLNINCCHVYQPKSMKIFRNVYQPQQCRNSRHLKVAWQCQWQGQGQRQCRSGE